MPTYVPLGFGSYHWSQTEPDGRRFFVTVGDLGHAPDPEAACASLEAALDASARLRDEAGLSFVVAPVRSVSGDVLRRIPPHLAVSVFPFIDGRSGNWGDDLAPAERDELFRLLAELHRAPLGLAPGIRGEGGRPPFLTELTESLARSDEIWTGGPFSEPARHLLLDRRELLAQWLGEFHSLAQRCGADSDRRVLTHGETHPGNLMRSDGRLLLIDWDTLGTALPERDLWTWDDGTKECFAAYEAAAGRPVDPVACAFFRLAWDLRDLVSYLNLFRSPHDHGPDSEKAWRVFSSLLRG